MSKSLPPRPDLDQLKKQAKELLRAFKSGDPEACKRFEEQGPLSASGSAVRPAAFSLHHAQAVIAREYGFATWAKLKQHVESLRTDAGDLIEQLKSAFANNDAPRLRELLERHPEFKAKINEPIGPFDSPAITHVRSREM